MASNDFINLRSQSYADSLVPDTVLDAGDPIHQIKKLAGLSSINSVSSLIEYNGDDIPATYATPSLANQKIQHQQENNIQPGTPEWFRLWFAKPDITGEDPFK